MIRVELDICKFYKVLPTEERFKNLTWMQKLMLWQGINDDKKEFYSTVEHIIEILKPWLDKDLWFNMQKETENSRENINWNKPLDGLDEITIME